jgi:hypothetical protein
MAQKALIQDIRKDRFGCVEGVKALQAPKDDIFSALLQGRKTLLGHIYLLSGLIDDLQSEKHHFLFELIQNAGR